MAELVGIYIAEKKAGEPLPVSEIRAIPATGWKATATASAKARLASLERSTAR